VPGRQLPRYQERPSERVTAALRARLESGEWQPGEQLPSVARLAAEYEVARATVARALHALAGEGLVRIVDRWGVFRA
jgi:DNA-binding GntR family transcriptional regulator